MPPKKNALQPRLFRQNQNAVIHSFMGFPAVPFGSPSSHLIPQMHIVWCTCNERRAVVIGVRITLPYFVNKSFCRLAPFGPTYGRNELAIFYFKIKALRVYWA